MPSSIGHVLLEQNPKTKIPLRLGPSQRLVFLSSRTEKGISESIDRVKSLPRDDEYLGLVQNAFSENIVGHLYRGYTIFNSEASSTFDFQVTIFKILRTYSILLKRIDFLQEVGEINRPVWFVFGGMGSQWPGMASDLMEIPCFAESIRRCDKYIRPIGYDIIDIITNSDPEILARKPIISFLAIASMHVSKSLTKK